ncbi:hypothetical protein N7466_000226 [Penicillium verhagenii]|uniref:uncharacterized protein n=1 Tax=Penicillium verhagenii TaxID=1562060 RepID=UPI00254572DB|nr:uncharacterized protein N7466_000226 [Penicillium verhagenii]KAJ5947211.1 hypothetical protein N7466_000226 [Penicillium verhagenii]
MQSFLEQRRIYKQLEKQFVVKHNYPDDVWTHERRYWYRDGGGISSEERFADDGAPAARRREHGQRTSIIPGPALQPRHSLRAHLGREEDIERQDWHPAFDVDPFTINTRDTLGSSVDMMLTGIEGSRARGDVSTPDGLVTDKQPGEEEEKIIIITYEGDCDPADPHNWSMPARCASTALLALMGGTILFSSVIDATALTSTRKLFHTGFEVESVPTALFLFGLGFGALITAPISELVGRNPVYLTCLPLFMLFDMGAGMSQNFTTRCVCRGLAGWFGSAPLVCSAAALVDLWSLIERNYAFPFYSIFAFLGATVAPVPGAIINWTHSVTWRFVDWTTIMLAGISLFFVLFFLPETYSPVILHWKAKQLRRLTKDDHFRSPLEFRRTTFYKRLGRALYRPTLLLWTEPIIIIFSCYLAVIFIILYTFSAGFISVFSKKYHLTEGQTGVTFLSISTGVLLGSLLVPYTQVLVRRDIFRARDRGQSRPDPETNLYLSMFGAPAIPVSLFWMGWTARPSISMWCPLVAAVLFGFGVYCVFVSSYQYITASFENHAASALSSLQMFRLVAAGVMAVLADIMYNNLGVAWSMTLLGGLATLFMPVPYIMYIYGSHIRRWSRHASSSEG